MTHREILEWTMGWAWPILIGFAVLMAWGIERIAGWNEPDRHEEPMTTPVTGRHCVCQYDEP
jgi:hypothetical protein